jgi:glucose-1-phosphate thymidylyltransferase
MKIIVPMAGRGTRLRPHTLITPKPLLPIAGKPIVQRLMEDIVEIYHGSVEEIAFIIGDFGKEVETQLMGIADSLGAKGSIYHQEEPLGTAHAIWQARESMSGEIIIAFADTLFKADFRLDRERDGAIWVKRVENPSAFGVVTLDAEGVIQKLVEKPVEFVSDLAIIGIYYIKDSAWLLREIQNLLDNDIRDKGEYQLTNALENMKAQGAKLVPGVVDEWMDCGNKEAVLDTMKKVLQYESEKGKPLVSKTAVLRNSVVIPPCYIGEKAELTNSVVGPYVSIGDNCKVSDSVIQYSAIRENSEVANAVLNEGMIGMKASFKGKAESPDIGDFSRT